jgi:hypothetical protein
MGPSQCSQRTLRLAVFTVFLACNNSDTTSKTPADGVLPNPRAPLVSVFGVC